MKGYFACALVPFLSISYFDKQLAYSSYNCMDNISGTLCRVQDFVLYLAILRIAAGHCLYGMIVNFKAELLCIGNAPVMARNV